MRFSFVFNAKVKVRDMISEHTATHKHTHTQGYGHIKYENIIERSYVPGFLIFQG